MKTMHWILYIFLLWGCDKPVPKDTSDTILRLVWKADKGIKRYNQISQDPVLYNDRLVIGYQTESDEGYVIYDKNNGKRIKEINKTPSFDVSSYIHNGVYYSTFGLSFRTINLDHFQESWHKVDSKGGDPYITMLFDENKVIVPVWSRYNPVQFAVNKFKFVSSNLDDLVNWQDYIQGEHTYSNEAFGSSVKSFAKLKNIRDEAIYYFITNHGFHNVNKMGEFQMHAYNKTLEKYEWQSEIMYENSNAGLPSQIPLFFNNTVIVNNGYSIICRERESGRLVWRTKIENGITGNTINLYRGKIVSIDQFGILHQTDASTGQVLKKLNLGSSGTMNWAFHNGIIYFTIASGKLMAIDAETLIIKWELTSPNSDRCSYCTFGFESPVVDPETNRLYISDAWEVYCYQLPE
jgi:hypothetical protein